jgi:hypothetical protein
LGAKAGNQGSFSPDRTQNKGHPAKTPLPVFGFRAEY